jgi:hypothetical protein
MNERELANLFNSGLVFNHLLKNKTPLILYLEGGAKISGRLIGWDQNYLIMLCEKSLQMVPNHKLERLQAEFDNIPNAESRDTTEKNADPELFSPISKPKFTLEPGEGTEIKDQIMASKPQNTDTDSVPAKERLDHLVKNW